MSRWKLCLTSAANSEVYRQQNILMGVGLHKNTPNWLFCGREAGRTWLSRCKSTEGFNNFERESKTKYHKVFHRECFYTAPW